MNEIKFKAPKGATHYFKNDYVVAYFFYSNDVNMWFVGLVIGITGRRKFL